MTTKKIIILKKFWKNLNEDNINDILGYDERFAIRRGIPVNRILKTDERYTQLLTIPEKRFNKPYSDTTRVYIIINPNKDLSISYNTDNNNNHWINVMFVSYVFNDDNSGNGHIDFPNSIKHKFIIC
jgi:hypothetical protein